MVRRRLAEASRPSATQPPPLEPRRRRLPSHLELFGVQLRTPSLLLCGVEFVLFYLLSQAAIAAYTGTWGGLSLSLDVVPALLTAFALSAGAVAMGLYSPAVQYRDTHMVGRCLVAFAVLAPAGLLVLDVVLPLPPLPLGQLLLAAGLATAAALAMRKGVLTVFDERLFQRRVLILGAGREARRIGERMRRRSDRRGFELVAYAAADGRNEIPERETAPVLELAQLDLPAFCRRHDVHEIVVAWDDRRGREGASRLPVEGLLDCRFAGVQVTELVAFIEREAGRIDTEILRPSWLLFARGFSQPLRRGTKRLVDLAAALGLLLIAWPVMLVTAIAIKLEDGRDAPVFYRQERTGLKGRPFQVFKFRSMRTDAERFGEARWAEKDDPRVTRVGHVIRLLRIDELPQLLNVLRGEMSLLGPRPERPVFVERFCEELAFYGDRHRVKPGLTGWAQLNYPYGSGDEDARRKLEFDLYYVKNYSVILDLMILLRTVEVVLFGRGAR
jgi:sugar transferase (PEP-CTERM system associated)